MNPSIQHISEARIARTGRAGFTLVEMMVAVGLSTIVIGGVFALFTFSSRTFVVQAEVGRASTRLNFALEQIATDLRNAGFQATPNSDVDPKLVGCPPPQQLVAVELEDNLAASDYVVTPDHNPGVTPDSLWLLGPYRTQQIFEPTIISATGQQITFSAADFPTTAQEFTRLFDGAILRVDNPDGNYQFANVSTSATALDFSERTVRLQTALRRREVAPVCGIDGLFGPNHRVSALHHVRYRLAFMDQENPRDTVLVREVFGADRNTPLQSVIVARNIVDFQVWFDGAVAGGGALIDGSNPVVARDGDWVDDEGTLANNAVGRSSGVITTTPQRVRYAYVELSARQDTEDRRLQRTDDDDGTGLIRTYNVEGEPGDGIARVVTVRIEVELPNMTFANML